MITQTITVTDIIGSPLATTQEKGEQLYRAMTTPPLKQGTLLVLDFTDVRMIWAAFVAGAFGPYYTSREALASLPQLHFIGLSAGTRAILDYGLSLLEMRLENPEEYNYRMNILLEE